jgi:hypothetical protein
MKMAKTKQTEPSISGSENAPSSVPQMGPANSQRPKQADTFSLEERRRLTANEAIIERGKNAFIEVGNALAEIRDQRLYRADFKSFAEYVDVKWGLGRSRAYQLIDASAVMKNLSTMVDTPPPGNERQVRELSHLAPGDQHKAWKSAVNQTDKGKPSAANVKQARQETVERKNSRTSVSDQIGQESAKPAPAVAREFDLAAELRAVTKWLDDTHQRFPEDLRKQFRIHVCNWYVANKQPKKT